MWYILSIAKKYGKNSFLKCGNFINKKENACSHVGIVL